jgi:preprotein translocase subunit SecD
MNIKFGWRIWLLIIVLILSLLAIVPFNLFEKGVVVSSITPNSTAFDSGLRQGQIITAVDGQTVSNTQDYYQLISQKFLLNQTVKSVITTNEGDFALFSNSPPEITIKNVPKTNLQLGLDLAGGARALIKAQNFDLSSSQASELADVIKNRLNVYGLEDINVNAISDLSGKNFVSIEIAGATPSDLQNLISQQGVFEAKIGNETVFEGGKKDITSVARSGQDALVEACNQVQDGTYACNFRFTVYLSDAASKRQAGITKTLDANVTSNGQTYLSKNLDLFLDGQQVDSLLISQDLKGVATTQISISGSGTGATQNDAIKSAQDNMKKLQTILITGSLPYKLEIVKLDTLSPLLGDQFLKSIILAGLVSMLAVAIIVFARYRKFKASLAVLITSLSEVVIILGIAALIRWNLDLPSIAGILTTIGTGVDQQIIILDEARETTHSIAQRIKRALAIILGAYFTGVVAMIPLYWAAAGFFKGFAITTIIGITAGILISRPAFSDMIKRIEG